MKKRIEVCSNCRVSLENEQAWKHCRRCAPHIKRMYGRGRWRTTRWKKVSAKCSGCGKIKAVVDFYRHPKKSSSGRVHSAKRHLCKVCTLKHNADKYRISPKWWVKTVEVFDGSCVYCGAEWEEKDHLHPVSKGGETIESNLVPACRSCNRKKNNILPEDFAGAEKTAWIRQELEKVAYD